MNTFAIGPGLLLMLLGLGGFSGLPLSLPPLPPDPLVERAAPAECLLHVALAGQAKAAAGAANRVEALLAEAEVQRFIGEVDSMVAKMLARQDAAADAGGPRFTPAMRSLAFMLLTRPAALTIDSLAIGPNGVTAEASLLVNCGPDVDRFRAALDATIAQLRRTEAWLTLEEFDVQGLKATRLAGLPPEAPVMAWGFKDGSFVAAVGTDALEHLLVRLADKARPAPAWKTALEKRLPLERRSMLAHVDVAKCLAIANGLNRDPGVAAGVEASGLGGLRAVQAIAGLTQEEMASATILDFEGQPAGFFAAGKRAIAAADLRAIPADATMAQVLNLDLAAMLQTGLAWMEAVDAGASARPKELLEKVQAVAGIDVEKHILEPLGDTWTACALPGEGPMGLPRTAVSVGLDDAKTFTKTLAAVTALVTKGAAQPGMPQLKLGSRKAHAGEQQVFTARLGDSPLEPAWCVDGDRLLIGVSAEAVEAMIAQRAAPRSLADVAEVEELLGERVAALGYQEPQAAVAALIEAYAAVDPLAAAPLAQAGLTLPRLPSADAVTKHLRPAVSVVRRAADGDVIAEGRSSLPLGPLGGAGLGASPATVGMVAGLMLPAVQSTREAARRTVGMNNLRQLALAMHNHESAENSLPAAAICDDDGKPLLSWRVRMLPYLGEQDLHAQFKLDEPWDSEHNKKLVEKMPKIFAAPGDAAAKPGMTRYLVPTGKGTIFPQPDKATKLAVVSDGLLKTILIVEAEAAKAVPWTKPEDLPVNLDKPHEGLKNARPTGFTAAFADGSVRLIPADVAAKVLAAAFTRSGDEQVEAP